MSQAAYNSYFGQGTPDGAFFGADVSWYQGAGSYNDTMGYWQDFNNWCQFVCIRTSYGRSGDDGNQYNHFSCAENIGFRNNGRVLGSYHYIIPTSGVDGNISNFLSRSNDFVGVTSYDMLDFEEGPNPGNGFINQACDMVEQARQRPCFIYGGKSYLDAAGPISCPVDRVWVAHYPGRSANAWQPTTDWSSWGAPLMPNQYGSVHPGCWQWSSTAAGYSLDLDISTSPTPFGLNGPQRSDDMGAEEQRLLQEILNNVNTSATGWKFPDGRPITTLPEFMWNLWLMMEGKHMAPLQTKVDTAVERSTRGTQIAERMNADVYIQDTSAPTDRNVFRSALAAQAGVESLNKKIEELKTGGIDVNAIADRLASVISGKVTDYDQIRSIIREELAKLTVIQRS